MTVIGFKLNVRIFWNNNHNKILNLVFLVRRIPKKKIHVKIDTIIIILIIIIFILSLIKIKRNVL